MAAGSCNSDPKVRGMAHWLHKQWLLTKGGQEQHKADCARMKALPKKAKVHRYKKPVGR